ncbi:histidyl-tRNA synthetase [Syntrophobotulus glycolicus DSM 8271]|uniref:Histidine--tRNA ligase n=1 Tax=Syntrophobotulus glycolicus (strain DSM 8271 / FlGlyR) TaxID=645991 RepID=F0T250_SYNGF|nr:histidine--tRNA ligase [Syntrophobotulus glycolicus]ADY56394.1 histidyl-tRNA synthetase [Syntrophobotulus glycolicus DSM 8271]
MKIQRPKGTQDIIPGIIEKWHVLEGQIRKICEEYGFQEIRTPIFEATELFQRGVGETTDIVNKEMYTFQDKGNRSMTLRPEGTAAVCRAFVENKLYALPQPVKLYYRGPMFRYENTQAGRFRQFSQFGAEVFGGEDPLVDAEVIQLVWELFNRLGLKDLVIQINSVGCPVCRAEHKSKLQAFLEPKKEELCADCQSRFDRNPLRILDCKSKHCKELIKGAPTILEMLCADCRDHFTKLQEYLEAVGIAYVVDAGMVRGLDYYRKTAFEVLVREIGAQSAICGGGRYDGLVEEIGGPSTPGIGFAMGIERVISALESQKIDIAAEQAESVTIIALGEAARLESFKLVSVLRKRGIKSFLDVLGRNMKSQMKAADRAGSKIAVIIGEDELARKTAVLRDMKTGGQAEIPLDLLAEKIEELFKRS